MGKRRKPEQGFEFQNHWLGKEDGSDSYYAYWYDPERRKTRRRSLDENDFERAKVALVQHVLKAAPPEKARPETVSLGQVLAVYLDQTDAKPCGPGYRSIARYIGEWWSDALVSELTSKKQKEFIVWLGGKGFSPGYIKRIIGVISGALGYAVENDILLSAPPKIIMALGKIADLVQKPPRRELRRLSIPELAQFIDAVQVPHLLRYTILALNTVARPDAILELRWPQIADGLVALNPSGRLQTKKHRPTVPATDTLSSWVRAWRKDGDNGLVVHYHGREVDDPRVGIQDVAERAGLLTPADFDVDAAGVRHVKRERSIHPYTFRRSMARILRSRGVSMEDLGAWMGHRIPDAATTEVFYADAAPEYLIHVRTAIDAVMDEIATHLKHTPMRPGPVEVAPEWWTRHRLYGAI